MAFLVTSCATRETPTSGRPVTSRASEEPSRMAVTTGLEGRSRPVPEYREEEYRERLKGLLLRHDRGDDTGSIALVSRDEELRREIQFFRDRRAEGMSVIEALVQNPPAMPD